MNAVEKDIIAALLKIVRGNELIPEVTYQGALSKLFYTFDAGGAGGYDEGIKTKRSA